MKETPRGSGPLSLRVEFLAETNAGNKLLARRPAQALHILLLALALLIGLAV